MGNNLTTQTFLDLVKIDSPSGEESALAEYIVTRLGRIGIKFERDEAGNLFARVGNRGTPAIICAHMDTVEPGRGVRPQVKNGLITSDGTTILGADNKVAVAAIICALESAPLDRMRSLEVIFTTKEETEGGVNQLDFSRLKSKSGLIADRAAKIGSIVLSSPWIINLEIKIIGKTAHAGRPQEGINALSIAAKCLAKTKWGRLNSLTTANIGLINGGTAMNSIPGQINLTGEIRSFSKPSLDTALEKIKDVFNQVTAAHGAKLDISAAAYCSGYKYTKTTSAVKEVIQIMHTQKIIPFFETAFGASDANAFAGHGIDVVTIGDGCNHPHTVDESVSESDLAKLQYLFQAYITHGF